MIEINGVLIGGEVTNKKFVCNLNACKGACCWEGDYGAPLTAEEKIAIEENLEGIKPKLNKESLELLEVSGPFEYYEEAEKLGTNLHHDGACVFLTKDDLGIAKCGIEEAYNDGTSTFRKPISCHLYPIRVTKYEEQGFEAWNYEEWDICSEACKLGESLQVPIYQFVKDAIIRYKGQEFYDQMDAAAADLSPIKGT